MQPILIVPDIHGRNFWKPALDFAGEVVFLGDYVDPYPHEGFSPANALEGLQQIVEFKRNNPERVTLLVGNHELSYVNKQYYASRFSSAYYIDYHDILTGSDTAELFQLCRQVGAYLFIHAGISKGWYDLHAAELQTLGNDLETQLNNLYISNKDAFYEVSRCRGGLNRYGSPLWADVTELYREPEHFSNEIIQIIGHTQLTVSEPFEFDNFRLVDNRQLYLLNDNRLEHYI